MILFDSHPPVAYNKYNKDSIDYKKVFPIVLAAYLQLDISDLADLSEEDLMNSQKIIEHLMRMRKGEIAIKQSEVDDFYNKWIYSHKLLKKHHIYSKLPSESLYSEGRRRNH